MSDFLDTIQSITNSEFEYRNVLKMYEELKHYVKVIFTTEEISNLKGDLLEKIKRIIVNEYKSGQLLLINCLSQDNLDFWLEELSSSNIETYLLNRARDMSENNDCNACLISENQCVVINKGSFDEEFEQRFVDEKKIIDSYKKRFGIDDIPRAINFYHAENKSKRVLMRDSKETTFEFKNSDDLIVENVKECHFRNSLYEYLDKCMKGRVFIEYHTNMYVELERVDIMYIDNDIQRSESMAIIEIKMMFQGKYVSNGSSKYSLSRINDGISQLDTYCRSIDIAGRKIDKSYLALFVATDKTDDILHQKSKEAVEENEKCGQFNSSYEGMKIIRVNEWQN